jgi:recombination protein RecA
VGINKTGEMLDLGVDADIVEKSGAWYSYGEERLGQGRENAANYLREHTDLALDIENRLRVLHNLPQVTPEDAQAPAEENEK